MKVNNVLSLIAISTAFVLGLASCEKLGPDAPAENELLDGPIAGLSAQEQFQHLEGDIAFNDEIFTVEKGLGPIFVGTSCGSCHAGDGKGHPFLNFIRYGQNDSTGNKFANNGGDGRNQLQHKAIPGYEPEQLPTGAPFSTFIAPAVTGLGFLDAVPDADLLALADPLDLDGDGISGRPHYNYPPNYVKIRPNAVPKGAKHIFRFGKKAGAYDLLQQTVGAYNQDIGIASSFEPTDVYSGLEIDPEVSNKVVHDVVFYLKTLKIPQPRNGEGVAEGKQIFSSIKCAACHTPTLKSGPSPIAALANKEFHPYTDLLLHDMGPALDDGYTEGFALTAEWKTPALWGLGLSAGSQGGSVFLLHDGRAKSIEEAILYHGGEAQQSKVLYQQLSAAKKQQLLNFLESL